MKANRIFAIFISLICMLMLLGTQAFAVEYFEKMPEDMEKEVIRNEIVDEINATFKKDLPGKVTVEDVDLSKSYKFYLVNSIQDLGGDNFKKVRGKLENGDYIFEVPVFLGKTTYIASIQRYDKPLDDEAAKLMTPKMVEDYNKKLGHWGITVTDQYLSDSPFHDYYEMAAKSTGIRDTLPLLVGGIPPIQHPVALFPDEKGRISKLVATKRFIPDETGADAKNSGNLYPVFDYEKAKETILVLQREAELRAASQDEPEVGGDGFANFVQAYNSGGRPVQEATDWFPVIILSAAALVLIVFFGFLLRNRLMEKRMRYD